MTLNLESDTGIMLSTVTDADGLYFFELIAGNYTVTVDTSTLPPDLAQTFDLDGILDDSTTVPLDFFEVRLDVDFGYQPLDGSIGDTIWRDDDGDGVQDPDEPGIPGVTVLLKDSTGAVLDTRVTDADGLYLFDGLASGLYTVCVDETTLPDGVVQTGDPDGTLDNETDVDLGAGEDFLDADFGYQPLGSIGDTVWQDTDRDGVEDPGEPGIPGVTMLLKDEQGNVLDTDVTDADGMYLFEDLPAGTYTICVDTSTLPAGFEQTGDPDGILDNETTVPLGPGEEELDADFGYNEPPVGSLGDRVWFDNDGDGVQDPGEPGINGVTVQLRDDGGVLLDTQVTSGDGGYLFVDLLAADYTVVVVASTLPDGVVQTGDPDGTLDDMTVVSLPPGGSDLDNDFGYQPLGSIGDTVWQDDDGDGVQDPGEPGIPGVTVLLKDEQGNVLDTDVTDADGMYLFEDLPAGIYTICIDDTTLPDGYIPTGDPDGVPDNETTISLDPGEDELDADFGYQPTGAIGDTVWFDLDRDGVEDPNEPGIPGVTMILKDELGNVLETTVTDGDGMYLFTGLTAGVYNVCVDVTTLPPGLEQTGDPDGTLDDETQVNLGPPDDELGADFGYAEPPTGTIGDTIWLDLDGDGVEDPNEPGIPGVTVLLKDDNGNVIDTMVTDADGMYLFEDVEAGIYTICVDETTLPGDVTQTGDPDGVPDNETTISLDPGENELDADFGYQPLGEICGTVWEDTDGDGVQDANEPGIPGVTVELLDDAGNVIATVITDANGDYCFEDLAGGDYEVCVDESTLPPNFEQTGDPDGVLDGCTDVMLPPGGSDLDNDFGYQPPSGSIGDRVWLDNDGDGNQDPGEPGIPGVTVLLKDDAGNVLDTLVTDANGNYLFTDLASRDLHDLHRRDDPAAGRQPDRRPGRYLRQRDDRRPRSGRGASSTPTSATSRSARSATPSGSISTATATRIRASRGSRASR